MSRWVFIIGYALFAVAGLAIWLVTKSKKTPIASVGDMIDRLMHHRTTRIAILCGWLWVGWHFLVTTVTQAQF